MTIVIVFTVVGLVGVFYALATGISERWDTMLLQLPATTRNVSLSSDHPLLQQAEVREQLLKHLVSGFDATSDLKNILSRVVAFQNVSTRSKGLELFEKKIHSRSGPIRVLTQEIGNEQQYIIGSEATPGSKLFTENEKSALIKATNGMLLNPVEQENLKNLYDRLVLLEGVSERLLLKSEIEGALH